LKMIHSPQRIRRTRRKPVHFAFYFVSFVSIVVDHEIVYFSVGLPSFTQSFHPPTSALTFLTPRC
jgi:hypothetical protein